MSCSGQYHITCNRCKWYENLKKNINKKFEIWRKKNNKNDNDNDNDNYKKKSKDKGQQYDIK